ncbi:MAG: patatin-like phospholipase family protein [Saprospiraceae bacterium]|nr:patatin-like phospholipase family protein [Saprospiraceae bacterium]
MENKPFKILAIDGGGIKGLYSSTILEHLEEQFDCSLSDYFDLICGTSTGGLIALALSLKIPAAEVSNIYKNHGHRIFPQKPKGFKWLGALSQTLFRGKYSDSALREVLREVFGDRKIGESHNLLCIPSYSMTDGRPWIFKFDHKEGKLTRDNKALYVDVALATSAAPTYLPVCEIDYYDHKQFIDGGVWANNPTLVGVMEALRYFVGKGKEFDSIEVLSVSSLSLAKGKPVNWRRQRAFIDWRGDLFDTSMNGQNEFTDYVMNSLCELNDIKIKYLRIPSTQVSHEQIHLVDLDASSQHSLNLLCGKGNDMGLIYRKKPRKHKHSSLKKTL